MREEGLETQTIGRVVLAVAILGSSMAFIDGTVVNVVLPALQSALRASIADVQWVVEAYALMAAALLLVGGALGDMLGRRKVYVFGAGLFAIASACCGVSFNIDMLIAARAIQGVGAAFLIPGSLALITSSFPVETRGRAIGTWSGFTSVAAAIGPVLGGWLVQHSTWRWVFFLNIPVAISVVLLAVKIPESRDETSSKRIDWPGASLGVIGLAGITFALVEWPAAALHGSKVAVAAAIIGAVALTGFLVVERASHSPMIQLSLFQSRNFAAANVLTFFLYAALSGVLFFFPMNLIDVQHYTGTQAGSAFLPFVVLMFALSRWSGSLVSRYGSRLPLVVGPFVAACGMALLAVLPETGSYWKGFFPAVLVMGIGMSISVAPLTTTVMNAVPETRAGLASGINNAISRFAALLSIAVFGLILISVFNRSLDHQLLRMNLSPVRREQINLLRPLLAGAHDSDPAVQNAIITSFVQGYRLVMWLVSGLAVLSGIVAWTAIEPVATGMASVDPLESTGQRNDCG